MERIYLDNASTSFPKAPGVSSAMARFVDEIGCNVGRGSYAEAYSAMETVLDVRERLSRLFHAPGDRNIVFTANVTMSLNLLLKGLLRPGDHLLVSSLEHNAVMRPLTQLAARGVSFSRIPWDIAANTLDLDALPRLLRPNTKAVVMLHASNVCGAVLPVGQVGRFAREHGLHFILDAAQTAGVFPIHMEEMGLSAVAFTGHKGLLGPQGIGGFALTDALAEELTPLIAGGTGSRSDSEEMPAFLPDRLEAGTLNLPGIYGLQAALIYLEETGIDVIRAEETARAVQLRRGLEALPGARILGSGGGEQAPIVCADFSGRDNAEVAFSLEDTCGVLTRCGLHCAPAAHRALGTFPHGTVRFSPGHRTTREEIAACIRAVEEILSQ